MRRGGGVGITLPWSAPERLTKGKRIGGRIRTVVLGWRIPGLFLAVHINRIGTSYPGRHGEQLPQRDVRLARIVEGKYLGRHVFRREYFLVETVRDEVDR